MNPEELKILLDPQVSKLKNLQAMNTELITKLDDARFALDRIHRILIAYKGGADFSGTTPISSHTINKMLNIINEVYDAE